MSFPRNNSQPLTEADVFTEQRKKQYKNALQKIIEKNSDEEIWVKQFEEFEKSKFNKETHEKNMNYLQHAYQASSPDLQSIKSEIQAVWNLYDEDLQKLYPNNKPTTENVALFEAELKDIKSLSEVPLNQFNFTRHLDFILKVVQIDKTVNEKVLENSSIFESKRTAVNLELDALWLKYITAMCEYIVSHIAENYEHDGTSPEDFKKQADGLFQKMFDQFLVNLVQLTSYRKNVVTNLLTKTMQENPKSKKVFDAMEIFSNTTSENKTPEVERGSYAENNDDFSEKEINVEDIIAELFKDLAAKAVEHKLSPKNKDFKDQANQYCKESFDKYYRAKKGLSKFMDFHCQNLLVNQIPAQTQIVRDIYKAVIHGKVPIRYVMNVPVQSTSHLLNKPSEKRAKRRKKQRKNYSARSIRAGEAITPAIGAAGKPIKLNFRLVSKGQQSPSETEWKAMYDKLSEKIKYLDKQFFGQKIKLHALRQIQAAFDVLRKDYNNGESLTNLHQTLVQHHKATQTFRYGSLGEIFALLNQSIFKTHKSNISAAGSLVEDLQIMVKAAKNSSRHNRT